MSHKSTDLLLGLSDKVVKDVPHERVFFTAWSLLLAAVWIWSVMSWSDITGEQTTEIATAVIVPPAQNELVRK